MAYTIIQSGTSLQALDTAGTLYNITLPTGVTLNSALKPRFAIFGRYVVMTNSPTRPITIDGDLVARVLTPDPPVNKPVLSVASGGTLTGTYTGVKQTFVIKDASGNIIAESDYSPAATTTASPSTQYLVASGLSISPDTITGSRLYRPTTGGDGSVLFKWIELDGNTQTSVSDDTPDAGISLVAAPTLGSAPDVTLICEWRDRLWGVPRNDIDAVRYTESQTMYAWAASNRIPVPRLGSDFRGITGFIPRREALGVGKRNILQQLTGTSSSDFRVVKLSENLGVESQETMQVFKDTAFWLWKDGVYKWDSDGIKSISDGKVRSWFTTDSYFNRGQFMNAFAQIDPVKNKYRLFLAPAGSSVVSQWVEYDIVDKTWWGPHNTTAFTPTSAVVVSDANDTLVSMLGSSSGFLWQPQDTRTDNIETAISSSFTSKFHDAGTPDIDKFWGELSMVGKVQSAGILSITSKVGYLDAPSGVAFSYDMTLGRQRLQRLGTGKMVQLSFAHATAGQQVELYGYELPVHELGRR